MSDIIRIDGMACSGYDYAVSGMNTSMPEFSNDMDLMAFNAGINNANIKHDLHVKKVGSVSMTYLDNRDRISDKELSTVWGNN